ncbi:MAG TPA: G1 family glutamic endopeptidase [Actinocrinis sp.]|uniref:G1 family glutamic endopeptidase n=1 Tax=Actinocrinis sp. TaxID=1920516 RepID=UPI002D2C7605|nr:G1 family glutamic endopeptidase [Actinocrinis sp.]HZU56404.1 G1 family glutamic endopeptidase [Actinocrinis sp.]
MSPFHRSLRAAAAAALAAAPLAGSAAVAAPLAQAPMHHASTGTPFFISHGGPAHTTTTSTNWSGYAATGSKFSSVTTTFTQPAVDCSKGDGYSSFWVGLDGYNSNTVEQTGTEADCSGGAASYSAWYEMYPKFPVTYSNTVRPGDSITESVSFGGSSSFTLTLSDSTQGWSRTVTKKLTNAKRSSAEVIAEAPYSGGVLPLADFGKVSFSGSTVNGSTLSNFNPVGIDMVSSSGTPEATVSSLSGGSFSITWNSL